MIRLLNYFKCHLLLVMAVLNIIFHLVYLCKLVLFGNDRLNDRVYGIFVVQYNTCYFQLEHENVYCVQALLVILNNLQAVK